MTLKPKLIGGVALSAMLAVSLAGGAQAKNYKRHRPVHPSASESALKAEVNDLKAEVQALESRLDAQAAAQQQAQSQQQAQIQAAQSQAQAAQSSAQAAQTQVASQQSQIETIPTQVETATRKAAPKPGWWNNTTVGGTMFADVSYIDNKVDGIRNPQSGVDYDIKRLYLQVDHKFNDMFSVEEVTDLTYDSTTKATQLFVKKAWIQAHLSDALNIRGGASDMPWVPFVEKVYGYRYVENTFIDRTKFGTSTDWGLHLFGSLANNIVSYQVSVVNGSGYKVASLGTVNRTDAVDVEGRLSATFDHFTIGVGGYDGKLGKDVVGVPTFNTARRFDAIAAYTSERFRLGVEYLWAKDWNDVTQPLAAKTNTSEGWSAFGSFNFTPKFAVFGRYDWIKPSRDTAPTFDDDYFNVGVSYKPIPPLDFALVYKRENANNGFLTSSNGVVGGVFKGTYDEVGLFTQVKF